MAFLRQNFWKIIFVLFVAFLFLVNAVHESYPDEFDNILGGWYILHGMLPHVGFFTHHGPVPYVLAATVEIFSGQSFVRFRIVYASILIIVTLATYLLLRKRIGAKELSFYPFFIIFLGILGTYYWLQMLLADNIAALSFLPVYVLIVLKALYRKPFTLSDIIIASILSAIGLYSSLTYTYLYAILVFFSLFLYFSNTLKRGKILVWENLYPLLIFASPHLVFLLYLLITRSVGDYYYQNSTFNILYYIYNYPRAQEATMINPIRYAILIAHWFFVNFYTLLLGAKTFDFVFPVNMTMGVGNVAMILYLLLRRHYKLAVLVFLVLVFTSVRSDPLKSKETDYQAAVYNLVSFFNVFFILPALFKALSEKIAVGAKVVFGSLMLIVGVYLMFTSFHLIMKFNEKAVSKYMGTMPLIYDRPVIAPIFNSILSKDDYAWIGPFEFEELFYMESRIPSRYHILIYGTGASPKIREEMMNDFRKNTPKVIAINTDFNYLGKTLRSYSGHFFDFLSENYVLLAEYKKEGVKFTSIAKGDKIDLDTELYLRKDVADEMIDKLLERNYIKTVNQ